MEQKRKIIKKATQIEKELTIQEAMVEFIRYKIANARSKQTATTYNNSLKIFSKYLTEEFGNTEQSLNMFHNTNEIDNYVMWLRSSGNRKEVTVASHKRQLRVFFYWLMDRNEIPSYRIVVKNAQEEVPETFTEEEVLKLVQPPDRNADFVEYRNWVMVNLMLNNGNRRSTLIGYQIKDVDLNNRMLRMNTTKSKYAQQIVISPDMTFILKKYIAEWRASAQPEEPLFPDKFGDLLAPTSLTHSMNTYIKLRGVEKTGVHIFRHTFAKNWIKNDGNPLILQSILGHSSLIMTQRYARLFGEEMRKVVDSYQPFDKTAVQPKKEIVRTEDRKRGRR